MDGSKYNAGGLLGLSEQERLQAQLEEATDLLFLHGSTKPEVQAAVNLLTGLGWKCIPPDICVDPL